MLLLELRYPLLGSPLLLREVLAVPLRPHSLLLDELLLSGFREPLGILLPLDRPFALHALSLLRLLLLADLLRLASPQLLLLLGLLGQLGLPSLL
jgi:hypothetical protein